MTEITNVFLNVYDCFQFLGDEYKKEYNILYKFAQYSFGILFFCVRIFYMSGIIFPYFKDSFRILLSKEPFPANKFTFAYMLFSIFSLYILQFYWGYLIYKMLFVNKKLKDESKEK